MNRFSDKTVLITGGTSGIGLATALLFKEEGARVVVTGRKAEHLQHAQQVLGDESLAVCSDAGNLAEIDVLMKQVNQRFGRLDVLFVNAGTATSVQIQNVSEAQFDETMNVNVKGVFFTIQKALPLMRSGSSIIVTTSISNRMASPYLGIYGASKAALRSLVQSFGVQLIGRGIRVNAISAGPIETGLLDRVGLPAAAVQEMKKGIAQRSPIKRLGTAEEIARVVLFLASEDASYMVGEEMVVDGGISMSLL